MINLNKGSRFNLKKSDSGSGAGAGIERFCVGCKWGNIKQKKLFGFFGSKEEEIDLDLSCVMFDRAGKLLDWIYSPDYLDDFLRHYGYGHGKLVSRCGGIRHSGADRQGGSSDADNERIIVNTAKLDPAITSIVFFLNYADDGNKTCDFSRIPFASIRLFEGGTYEFYEGFLSSYMGGGDWFMEGSRLYMSERNGMYLFNTFIPIEGALVFVEEESDNFPYVRVPDMGRFIKDAPDGSGETAALAFDSFDGGGPVYTAEVGGGPNHDLYEITKEIFDRVLHKESYADTARAAIAITTRTTRNWTARHIPSCSSSPACRQEAPV